ncbi:MAG: bacillithiol biosynthesis cysteine-adding enzyme BshC [Candidatus Eisenbacteria bacterium]|nr:bacillithiol biosynthesis cysteine-adding enzyme BshC [Candidatus Eisenbacteria bacterium]
MASDSFSSPRFDVATIAWPSIEAFAPYREMARIAETMPALPAGMQRDASASPFLDLRAAARAVAGQNPHLPPPPVEARYVVAGQQAGLLSGPMYTILKAVSAIALARRWAMKTGEPVLPLFWIASEDHDILEINRIHLHERAFVHELPEFERGPRPQASHVPLLSAREPLLAFLRDALPSSEHKHALIESVASLDFHDYASAFRSFMERLFLPWELRFIDPIALRPLTAPVLAALIERWDACEEAFSAGARAMAAEGFTPPLERIGLFEIRDGYRVAVKKDAAEFHLATDTSEMEACDAPALAQRIRSDPARFSGNAAFRPICQDAVLPVAAMLGGPSELAYLRQIRPLYAVADVRPARFLPRISATFVEPGAASAARQAHLEGVRVFGARELLLNPAAFLRASDSTPGGEIERRQGRGIASMHGDAIERIEAHARALVEELDRLGLDPAPRWMRTSRDDVQAIAARVTARLREAEREAAGMTKARLEKLAAAVLPEGKPQERVVNVLQFLNLHGPGFLARMIDDLDPEASGHHLVHVDPPGSTRGGDAHEQGG